MNFRDFYNTLYKYYEENIINDYRVRIAHISGWDYYEGTIGNIPLKTFNLLSVFNVEDTKTDYNTKTYVIYVY